MPTDKQWYSCTYLGQSLCFRLRDAHGDVVHPVTFLDGIVHALQRYANSEADHGDELNSNSNNMNALRTMAQQVYGGVRVEVSLRDELAGMLGELALEGEDEEDEEEDVPSIEDWWSPLYIALCARHVEALVHLLRFHADYAAAVIDLLLHDYAQTQLGSPTKAAAMHHDCANTTWTVVPKETTTTTTTTEKQQQHQGEDAVTNASNEPPIAVPLLRCVLCRSWGGALVLLRRGAHVSQAITTTTTPTTHVHPSEETTTNSITSNTMTHRRHVSGLDPLPELGAAQRRLQEEADSRELAALLAEDEDGEESEEEEEKVRRPLRLSRVLTALEPFVQCVLYELEHPAASQQEEDSATTSETIHDLAQHSLRKAFTLSEESRAQYGAVPALYVQADILYTRCHANLADLQNVLHACYGTLSPILQGRSIVHTMTTTATGVGSAAVSASGSARQRSCSRCNTPIHSSMHSRTTSNVATRSSLAFVLGGGGGAIEKETTGKDSSLHPLSATSLNATLPPAVTVNSEPFWLECAPQDAQRVTFYATWIEHRDHAQEPFGPARMRRAKMFIQECHGTLHTLKRLCEAHAVPPRCVWSGVMLLCCKLLASSCTVEDFVDGMGTDSVAYWTLPLQGNTTSSNSSSGGTLPGAVTLLLTSGAMAATLLEPDNSLYNSNTPVPQAVASALRLLECKVATVLAGERGSASGTNSSSSPGVTTSTTTTVPSPTSGATHVAQRIASPLREYLVSAPTNHAERFADLWLGLPCACHRSESSNAEEGNIEWERTPTLRKFDTRAELLYYAVVERVLHAAEQRWANDPRCHHEKEEKEKGMQDSLFTALRGWVSMWEHFFVTLRDTIVRQTSASGGEPHDETEATVTEEGKKEEESNVSQAVATQAVSTETPHTRVDSSSSGTNNIITHTSTQAQLESVEVIDRLLARLREQLRSGCRPLPALHTALFGTEDTSPTLHGEDQHNNEKDSNNKNDEVSLEEKFNMARTAFADMASGQSNEIKLQFYALYKQATSGDVTGSQPWRIDVVAHAKWTAWRKLQGMSCEAAKEAYVAAYEKLCKRS